MGLEWIVLAVVAWAMTAPDPITAGARSGAAGAVAAVGQSAKSGYQARRAAAKARRTQKHLDRRAGWATKSADGKHVDPWGPLKLWVDDMVGEGGRVEAAAKAVGRALRDAGSTAKQGWNDSKGKGARGLPAPVKKAAAKAAAKVAERVEKRQQSNSPAPTTGVAGLLDPPNSAPTQGGTPTGSGTPTGTNEGNPMSQAISSEAGLLPIAEQLETIVEQLAQVAVQVETAQGLGDLSFDPGDEVTATIAALTESLPDPAKLTAMAEAIPAFRAAVEEHIAQMTGA